MWNEWIDRALEDAEAAGLLRRHRTAASADGRTIAIDGRTVILACGNGYLGLAHDPEVLAAAKGALEEFGASSQASRLVSGDHPLHAELEAECAALASTESALVVGSGYLANVGLITALGRDARIVSDELNHASIVDGCRGARAAETKVYAHADASAARRALGERTGVRTLLVTESLFSVDGDLAPLAELAAAARDAGALLVVDEAHGFGTAGPGGRGVLAHAGIPGGAGVVVGTFGKALGSYGAFVGCSRRLRELLVNRMRPAIYSTALPPSVLAASLAAVRKLRKEPSLVERLHSNARTLRGLLSERSIRVPGEDWSPILPVVIGRNDDALAVSLRLLEAGVLVPALRPPTVPPGGARLRISVSAVHTAEDLHRIADAVAAAAGSAGRTP